MTSGFSRLLSLDSPLAGPKFVDSLALRPSFPQATLIPVPESRDGPGRLVADPRSALSAQAAAILLRDVTFHYPDLAHRLSYSGNAGEDLPAGTNPRAFLFRQLYEHPTRLTDLFLDPTGVYLNWSRIPVPAALAVLRVHRTKFYPNPPMFLALLAHPSALPYGLTSPLFVPADPPIARLQPGGLLPPADGGAFPLLSSFLHDVRLLPLGAEPTLQRICSSRLSLPGVLGHSVMSFFRPTKPVLRAPILTCFPATSLPSRI
jgi:hypothetical protein